jgi:hypothetical protein
MLEQQRESSINLNCGLCPLPFAFCVLLLEVTISSAHSDTSLEELPSAQLLMGNVTRILGELLVVEFNSTTMIPPT